MSHRQRYRLVAMDLDGTLLTPEGRITDLALDVLEQIHQRGVHVIICTGRTLHKAQEVVHPIPFEFLLALHNGAILVESHSGRVLIERRLNPDQVSRILTFLNTHTFQTAVYSLDGPVYQLHYQQNGMNSGMERFLASKQSILAPCESLTPLVGRSLIHFVAVDNEERVLWGLEMLKKQVEDVHALASGGFYGNEYWFLEILAKQASKSQAIATVAQQHGIRREQIIAIGDNYNDLDMIRYAGTGVAMANAPEAIQAQADVIADSNTADGVARILQRLVLGL